MEENTSNMKNIYGEFFYDLLCNILGYEREQTRNESESKIQTNWCMETLVFLLAAIVYHLHTTTIKQLLAQEQFDLMHWSFA